MGKTRVLHIFYFVIAAALAGCAQIAPNSSGQVAGFPTAQYPRTGPSPVAASATPSSAEVQAFQQQIVDVHRDMLQVLQHLAGLPRQQQQQVGGMMVDLMAEEATLLDSMQPVQDVMTPGERHTAELNLGRIQANIRDMYRLMPSSNPEVASPKLAQSGLAPEAGEMGSQMNQLHERTLAHLPQMSIAQIQGVAANMVDLTGNLDRLKSPLGSGFARLGPEQRGKLTRQLDAMRQLTTQMVQIALSGQPARASPKGRSPLGMGWNASMMCIGVLAALGDLHVVQPLHVGWPEPAHAHSPSAAFPFGPADLEVPPPMEEWQLVWALPEGRRHYPLTTGHLDYDS